MALPKPPVPDTSGFKRFLPKTMFGRYLLLFITSIATIFGTKRWMMTKMNREMVEEGNFLADYYEEQRAKDYTKDQESD